MLRRMRVGRYPVIPRPISAVLIVVFGAVVFYVVAALMGNRYNRLHTCDWNRAAILSAEEQYWHRYNRCVLGDEGDLQELVRGGLLKSVPHCNYGGHYTVSDVGNDMIMVNCSFDGHENQSHITIRHMPSFAR
jgi:hypothetical protein